MRHVLCSLFSALLIFSASPLALATDAGTPCGNEGYIGCCDGTTVKRCVNGVQISQTCSGQYALCGWYNGKYACTDAERTDPNGVALRDCAQANNQDVPCGAIGFQGCCDGDVAKYCVTEANVLSIKNCPVEASAAGTSYNKCGWKTSGSYYTCTTDEGTDPNNTYLRSCAAVMDGGNPMPVDAGMGTGCGNVPNEGCCEDDSTVKFCSNGELITKTCDKDGGQGGLCGWSSNGYYCGSSTEADPTGAMPRLCSQIGAVSDGGQFGGEAGVKSDGGSIKPKTEVDEGCSCSLGAPVSAGTIGGILLLIALGVYFSRRRA